jgi:hypothetical protein
LLGRTPASVRQMQHLALATLREQLESNGWATGSHKSATSSPREREQS